MFLRSEELNGRQELFVVLVVPIFQFMDKYYLGKTFKLLDAIQNYGDEFFFFF